MSTLLATRSRAQKRHDMRMAQTVETLRGIARTARPFGDTFTPAIPGAWRMTKAELVAALDQREQTMRADIANWAIYVGEDILATTEKAVLSERLSPTDSRTFDEIVGEMRTRRLSRELEAEEGFTR